MTKIRRKKIYYGLLAVGLLISSYIFLKYLFPLIWPFVLAYGLAVLIYPIVNFLEEKLHFHKNAATALTLVFVLGALTAIFVFLIDKLAIQIRDLIEVWPEYEEKLLVYVREFCGTLERILRIDKELVYGSICDGVGNAIDDWQGRIMPTIMNNSIQTIIALVDVVIVIALTVMAVFYLTRDMKLIRNISKSNIYYNEIVYFKGLISRIVRAYIRSQIIIMSLVAFICSVGLVLIGNDYYILLGIVIGILDALPLIGVGAVMIPWSIIYMFIGEYVKAAILFTIFIICYLLREFLEPRLMGQQIGMSPIASLISIYVGYKLLGFVGMVAGPLVYVLIADVLRSFDTYKQ